MVRAVKPDNGLMLQGAQLATHKLTAKGKQAHHPISVVPHHRTEWASDFDAHPEFFHELTGQGRFRKFARIHLPARKFPTSAEMLSLRPQARKKLTRTVFNHAANHVDHSITHP